MYDARSEAHEFVADSRGEAVSKACDFFGTDEDALNVKELAEGSVAGLGGRALIVAVPKNAPKPRPSRDEGRRDEGRRESRGRDEGRGRDGGRDGGRGRDRGRGRDGGRGREESHGRSGGGRGDQERERDRETPIRVERERPDGPPPESKGTASGEIGPIGKFLLGVVERMQLGSFEISEEAEGDVIAYELKGAAAEELGSGDGRVVDALQLLANQVAMRTDDDAPRIVIDAEGDSERRESFLERLAERAARRAQDTKRSVALDPMNPRDRRIVHVALRDSEGIATMSIGSGRYRQVVVVPEGSPDYEEARRSGEQASTRD